MSALPRKITAGLFCFLLALVVYRAKTQAFTIDEAFAFNLYVDQPLSQFATHYDACNHVLHTLATKFVRYWLGTSELVLRLVSLAGALLYLIAAARLCRMIAGAGWARVAGFAALGFNPLVLDFLVAARGYGLAVALLLWSLYYSLRWLEESKNTKLLWRAGLCAGLSIAANLTMLVPVAALGFVVLVCGFRGRRTFEVLDHFGGPAVVTAFVLLILPLSHAAASNFYLGSGSLADAAGTLWNASIRYQPERSPLAFLDNPAPLLALLCVSTGATGLVLLARRRPDPLAVIGPVLLLSIAALVALHRFAGVLYPYGRTGLYLIPLLLLALLGVPRHAGVPVVAVFALAFAAQLDTRFFGDWKFDAANHRLARVLAAQPAARENKVLAVSWVYEQSFKYYRKRRRLHWLRPEILTRDLEKTPADYYVLTPEDSGLVDKLGLEVLARDRLSGATLARRRT